MTMAKKKIECGLCRYWHSDDGLKTGLCRRSPPVSSGWPSCYASDWCGEFCAKDPDPKQETDTAKEEKTKAHTVIAHYINRWRDLFGTTPHLDGADAAAAKHLLKGRELKEALWIVDEFLEEPPKWNADNNELSLRHIPRAANKILLRKGER